LPQDTEIDVIDGLFAQRNWSVAPVTFIFMVADRVRVSKTVAIAPVERMSDERQPIGLDRRSLLRRTA
jgi:hypothetical protein